MNTEKKNFNRKITTKDLWVSSYMSGEEKKSEDEDEIKKKNLSKIRSSLKNPQEQDNFHISQRLQWHNIHSYCLLDCFVVGFFLFLILVTPNPNK